MSRSILFLASTFSLAALALGGCGYHQSPDEFEPDVNAQGEIIELAPTGGEGLVVDAASGVAPASADPTRRDETATAKPAPAAEPVVGASAMEKAKDGGGAVYEEAEADFDDARRNKNEQSATRRQSGAEASAMAGPKLAAATTTTGRSTVAAPVPSSAYAPAKKRAESKSPAGMAAPMDSAPTPDAISNSEQYTDYGVNGFTLSQLDRLSTFSIDVDTASYAMSRRKLQEGSLPVQAGVRAEEFINALDYDYAAPKTDSFAVTMDAMPDPFRSGHHILRVGVQGKELSQSERPRVHLTFLADVSGSMSSPDKLPLAQEALHLLVDRLEEGDTVALCTYAGRVATILPATDVTNKRRIHDAIDSLQSGGSTAMSSGIDLAYEQAWGSFEAGAENRVIVLSDGDANVGRTSFEDMLSQIKGYADKGVTLTTVGFGQGNYKDTLMEQLANKGDGNSFYIDSKQEAEKVFVQDVGSAMITIARDVKIQVNFNPESVVAYRLIGYENRDIADKDFRNDRVDAGEVGSGHSVTALYDVILKDGYQKDLASVHLRFEAPGADKAAVERKWTFQSNRLAETPTLAARDLRIAYGAGTLAEVLRASPHAAEIDLAEVAAFTGAAARHGNKGDAELVSLIRTADRLGADQVKGAVSTR